MAKFIPYTFTKKDVIGYFKNDKQYENWIAGQVRSKKIVKVRNGLYVQVDVSGYPLTTKFELATKIAEDACVCYHSFRACIPSCRGCRSESLHLP